MSLTGHAALPAGTRVAMPRIVLTLDCDEAQRYLNAGNDVLESLTDAPVARINLHTNPHSALGLQDYVWPYDEEHQLRLIRRFRHLSLDDMSEWIGSEDFVNRARFALTMSMESQAPEEFRKKDHVQVPRMLRAVRVVLIEERLLVAQQLGPYRSSSALRRIFEGLLPNAHFFAVSAAERWHPTRIWHGKLCATCTAMQPVGGISICRDCGLCASTPRQRLIRPSSTAIS